MATSSAAGESSSIAASLQVLQPLSSSSREYRHAIVSALYVITSGQPSLSFGFSFQPRLVPARTEIIVARTERFLASSAEAG